MIIYTDADTRLTNVCRFSLWAKKAGVAAQRSLGSRPGEAPIPSRLHLLIDPGLWATRREVRPHFGGEQRPDVRRFLDDTARMARPKAVTSNQT
jgi:hypothetical protein